MGISRRWQVALHVGIGFVLGTIGSLRTSLRDGDRPAGLTSERQRQTTQGDGPPMSVVEEIVPSALRDNYSEDDLPFPVTRSMLRQSRPIVGNTERLQLYLKKLLSGRCTHVLFMGGSVTHGRAVVETDAYPAVFVDWLNAKYPCSGKHTHSLTRARDSAGHFTEWSEIAELDSFDLAILEFNINDGSVGGLPHALEKGKSTQQEFVQNFHSEILLRRLLLLRKPDPVAIITFNGDFDGRKWMKSNEARERKNSVFRTNEPMKLYVSNMYGIPVCSVVSWFIPLSRRKGVDEQFGKYEDNIYSSSTFHADDCCHPRREGHRLLALVLAFCIHDEENEMKVPSDRAPGEHDLSADPEPILPDPLYLSPEEDRAYINNSNLESKGYDFTDIRKQWEDDEAVVASKGWSWYADSRNKFGYIASAVEGGPHLAIKIEGGRYGKVEVVYLASYANFGIALAWIDDEISNIHHDCVMYGEKTTQTPAVAELLYARWGERVSVPTTQLLTRTNLNEGESKILHFCLTPRFAHLTDENKFKLLSIRTY